MIIVAWGANTLYIQRGPQSNTISCSHLHIFLKTLSNSTGDEYTDKVLYMHLLCWRLLCRNHCWISNRNVSKDLTSCFSRFITLVSRVRNSTRIVWWFQRSVYYFNTTKISCTEGTLKGLLGGFFISRTIRKALMKPRWTGTLVS